MEIKRRSTFIPLQQLEVYRLSRELSKIGWEMYCGLNWQDKKMLGGQCISATDSVGANITEGYFRFHSQDTPQLCCGVTGMREGGRGNGSDLISNERSEYRNGSTLVAFPRGGEQRSVENREVLKKLPRPIPRQLAAGMGRGKFYFLDRVKFYYQARASLAEAALHWLELLLERKKIVEASHMKYKKVSDVLSPKLNNFIASTAESKKSSVSSR